MSVYRVSRISKERETCPYCGSRVRCFTYRKGKPIFACRDHFGRLLADNPESVVYKDSHTISIGA